MLTVRNLKTPLFGPVSFSLQDREILGVYGESGAGKTILLRAIADLDPHEGELALDGRPASAYSPPRWRQTVSWLTAEPRWWSLTAAGHFSQLPPREWLDALSLTAELLQRDVSNLSEGQRQRLALLRMLVLKPRVLLLDEPTARLDSDNCRRVETLISSYVNEEAAGALWVSHDAQQLERVATRVVRVEGGRIISPEAA